MYTRYGSCIFNYYVLQWSVYFIAETSSTFPLMERCKANRSIQCQFGGRHNFFPFSFVFSFLNFMYISVLPWVSGPLELELRTVTCNLGAGNWILGPQKWTSEPSLWRGSYFHPSLSLPKSLGSSWHKAAQDNKENQENFLLRGRWCTS